MNRTIFHQRLLIVTLLTALMGLLYSNGFAAESPKVQGIIDQGLKQVKKGNIDTGIRIYEQALKIEPENAEVFFQLGQAYLQKRDVAKSVDFLRRAVEKRPKRVIYALVLGSIYERAGRPELAIELYQRLIDSGSKENGIKEAEKRLALASGKSLAAKGETNAALLIYNGLLLDYPNDAKVLFSIGAAYMQLNRVQEAEEVFKKLEKLNPKSALVQLNLATIYERTNRWEEAKQHYLNIVKLKKSPKTVAEARYRYDILSGKIHMQNQDYDKALEAFTAANKLIPTNSEALFNKGLALLASNKVDEAKALFGSIIKKNPNDFNARLNIAAIYTESKEYDKAKAELQYVIENDKSGNFRDQAKIKLNKVHTSIADDALKQGNVEESLQEYQKALDYYSGNVKASFTRGLILVKQKKYDEARVEFESIIEHVPDNIGARVNLANIYEQLQQFGKSAEQYEKIIQISPDSREGKIAAQRWKVIKARALWAESKLTDAEVLLQEAIAENEQNVEAYKYLGIIQSAKGNASDAAAAFEKVLSMQPNNQGIRFFLGQTYEQQGLDELAAQEYRRILFTGAHPIIKQQAKDRLDIVESRLSGFTNVLAYQFQYDDNLNLNDANPIEEIRADLAFSVTYSHKFGKDWHANVSWSPTYSSYHLSQIDYLKMSTTFGIKKGNPEKTYFVNYGNTDQKSLLSEESVSGSEDLSFGRSRKLILPAAFGLTPTSFEGEDGIPTSVQDTVSIRSIQSFSSVSVDSVSMSYSISASQNLLGSFNGRFGYTIGANRNIENSKVIAYVQKVDPVSGQPTSDQVPRLFYDSKDYEHNSHTVLINLSRSLGPALRGSLGTTFTYTEYINTDSSARVNGRLDTRDNFTVSANTNISYQLAKGVGFFGKAIWARNYSDLPTGLTRGEDDDQAAEAIETFQSTSLGNYTRFTGIFGVNMSF